MKATQPQTKNRSLRRELVIALCVALLTMGMLAGFVYYKISLADAEKRLQHELEQTVGTLANVLGLHLWTYDNTAVKHVCDTGMRTYGIVAIEVLGQQGDAIFSKGDLQGADKIRISRDVYFENTHVGTLKLAMSTESLIRVQKNSIGLTISVVLVVMCTATLVSQSLLWFFLTRPLKSLRQGIARLEKGDYAHEFQTENRSEIQEIVDAFQSLATRLAQREQQVEENTRELELQNQEMMQLRNLLSNIINSMPSILVGVDGEGRVMQWNQEAEQTTGITADNARGKPLAEVYPKLQRERDRLSSPHSERPYQTKEKIHWDTNGEPGYADITVYTLRTNGITGEVIRVDDVTARVRIEEMMIQTEKMLSVGGLAAGMAHEINNPLAGVLGSAQVLTQRLTKNMKKNQAAALECGTTFDAIMEYVQKRGITNQLQAISESGQRAARIVQNMLSFSRKSESLMAPQNMPELLDKVLELASNDYDLKKKFDFRKIRIVREYDNTLSPVPCDDTKVQQVLLNLLKNGAQSMAEKKELNSTYEPTFHLRLIKEANHARIEVQDTGKGMPEATRKRIFEPFFTTKKVGMGTGLGLSVSYFIITENHRGEFTVKSEPDKGSTFIIRLPLQQNQPTNSSPA